MAETSIEWADVTWNPVSGCTRVSAGCDHCYAVGMTHRLESMVQTKYDGLTVLNPEGDRHFNGQVRIHDDALGIPMILKKPRKVFVNSMSDLFHNDVPFYFIDRVFAVMKAVSWHTYQILTKRPERAAEYLASRAPRNCTDAWVCWPLSNVWIGTSIEDQATADKRIPELLKCHAAVRFLSCEPLLGPVDLEAIHFTVQPGYFGDTFRAIHRPGTPEEIAKLPAYPGVDWVIVGGESGHNARPMHPDWARSLRDQCQAAGVAFFFKQFGEWRFDVVSGVDVDMTTVPSNQCVWFGDGETNHGRSTRVGKKAAGRMLDGVEHNAFPRC